KRRWAIAVPAGCSSKPDALSKAKGSHCLWPATGSSLTACWAHRIIAIRIWKSRLKFLPKMRFGNPCAIDAQRLSTLADRAVEDVIADPRRYFQAGSPCRTHLQGMIVGGAASRIAQRLGAGEDFCRKLL